METGTGQMNGVVLVNLPIMKVTILVHIIYGAQLAIFYRSIFSEIFYIV